jgi:hypothetical protein
MTTSYSCAVDRAHATPDRLFDFASDRLTWRIIRDNLPLERDAWWKIAQSGPWVLRARAVHDTDACLDDWTSRDQDPELYAKLDRGDLIHLGVIVEICAHGNLLGHASLWNIITDLSSPGPLEDSYRYLLSVVRDLISEAVSELPMQIERTISDLKSAALVLNGLEAPYMRTITFDDDAEH